MAPRRKRQRKKKKTQRGGAAPFFVDFKKGVNVTKDLIKALKKPVNVPKAKALVKSYKQQYQATKDAADQKATVVGLSTRDMPQEIRDAVSCEDDYKRISVKGVIGSYVSVLLEV